MAGYDPKAKRTHSPAAADGPAPVDDLLGVPHTAPATPATPAPTVAPEPRAAAPPTAGAASRPEARPLAPTPAAASGPDAKVLAALAAAVLTLLFFWRHRRRRSA